MDDVQFDKVMSFIESGKQQGAKLVAGGNRWGDRGYFIEPTVFADVQDNVKIAEEEMFGPVLSIIKFKDLDDVVERANRTMYGLAAGVWTRDIGKAHAIANAVRAGTVWVNCYDVFDAAAHSAEFKQSGIRRVGGRIQPAAITEVKTVTVSFENVSQINGFFRSLTASELALLEERSGPFLSRVRELEALELFPVYRGLQYRARAR